MSATETHRTTTATAAQVWAVLADGWSYAAWVVGASRMRSVEPEWPSVGARLHHSVGTWPLLIDDHTTVLDHLPERHLRLRGRAWPTGEACIDIALHPAPGGGCEIVLREDAVAGPATLIPPPVRHLLLGLRNRETLLRLDLLARAGAG